MKCCLIITTYMKLMVMDFAVSSAMEHHPTANHKPGNMEEQTHVHQLHFLPICVLDLFSIVTTHLIYSQSNNLEKTHEG